MSKFRAKVLIGVGLVGTLLSVAACQSTSTVAPAPSDYYASANKSSGFKATDPDDIAPLRTQMAGQFIRERKLDDAYRQLEKAFDADKNFAPAYDMMGVLLQQEGSQANLQKADGYFRRAIEIDPNFMQAHNNYGVYLAKMNRHTDAMVQFETAGSALGYEGRVGALENLGRTALILNKEAEAGRAFLRALDADPNSLIAHVELVDLLIKNGRITQAQKLYEETLILLGDVALNDPRILLQGIKLAHAVNDTTIKTQLSQDLLANFPLSEEAKTLKGWMINPEATWK